MLNEVKSLIKTLNIETSRNTKTSIKGCKNVNTRGIKIIKDKYEEEVLIYHNQLQDSKVKQIEELLTANGYNIKNGAGIIIVSK
jgi:hypothetical protein